MPKMKFEQKENMSRAEAAARLSAIADALKARGVEVLHIMGEARPVAHPYTSAASVVDGKLCYGMSRDLFA